MTRSRESARSSCFEARWNCSSASAARAENALVPPKQQNDDPMELGDLDPMRIAEVVESKKVKPKPPPTELERKKEERLNAKEARLAQSRVDHAAHVKSQTLKADFNRQAKSEAQERKQHRQNGMMGSGGGEWITVEGQSWNRRLVAARPSSSYNPPTQTLEKIETYSYVEECDKCGDKHPTRLCPWFPRSRESHQDAVPLPLDTPAASIRRISRLERASLRGISTLARSIPRRRSTYSVSIRCADRDDTGCI